MQYTRQLAAPAANGDGDGGSEDGGQPGVRVLGDDPDTGLDVTLRDGRFGPYVQLGRGREAEALSLPKGLGAGRPRPRRR